MTTNDDQYTPDEEQVRAWCRDGTGDYPDVMDEWLDRFLARVRREAKAEVLRETADWWAANPDDDVFETPGDTRNWMRDVAEEYEQDEEAQ